MINVAIVDDEVESFQHIKNMFDKFSKENNVFFKLVYYPDAEQFLYKYKPFDLIIMDIEMPYIDGMSAAKKLRKIDENVALIFVTNIAKFAINGYEVNAIDYLLKPVGYIRFSALIKKTIRLIFKNIEKINVHTVGGQKKVNISSINFIQISGHYIIYYTDEGKIESWGTLKDIEEVLPKNIFIRCNHNTIININNISSINKNVITIGNDNTNIILSTRKKKEVLNLLK